MNYGHASTFEDWCPPGLTKRLSQAPPTVHGINQAAQRAFTQACTRAPYTSSHMRVHARTLQINRSDKQAEGGTEPGQGDHGFERCSWPPASTATHRPYLQPPGSCPHPAPPLSPARPFLRLMGGTPLSTHHLEFSSASTLTSNVT